jgi:pimeloyl-ACP methyl ester carboxylesterase
VKHGLPKNRPGWWRAVVAVAMLLTFSGCASHLLATRIVKAPNRQGVPRELRDPKTLETADKMFAHVWRVKTGAPLAELSVGVIDPGMFKFTHSLEEKPTEEGREALVYRFTWSPAKDAAASSQPAPKGTLVLLHGIMMTKETMFPWAMFFAQEGYRVVLVDLRGHGRSTGRWIGFGAWERDDLKTMVDDLERRGLLAGKLGVFGISYGAVMGIHWAARDPRVAAMVALAPFSDPRKAIVDFARGVRPKLAARLGEETFAAAEAKASVMAGFKWSDVSVLESAKRMTAPVLFFHGRHDSWIPPSHSAELLLVAQAESRRRLSEDDHMTLTVRHGTIGRQALHWFEEKLGTSAEALQATAAR